MATYDNALGMWKDKGGGYHSSQSEATAADANFINDGDFTMGSGGIDTAAPDAPVRAPQAGDQPNPSNPGGISDNELNRRTTKLSTDATRTANVNILSDRDKGTGAALGRSAFAPGGWYDNLNDSSRSNYDYMHQLGDNSVFRSPTAFLNQFGESMGASHVGDVANPIDFTPHVSWSPEGAWNNYAKTVFDPNKGLGQTITGDTGNAGRPLTTQLAQVQNDSSENGVPLGGTPAPALAADTAVPDFSQGGGREGIDKETEDAKTRAGNVIEQNRDENAQLFADAFSKYDDLQSSDYGMSDEARGYQREGLQQQRDLLSKMLGFDEKAAATRYADQALSRQIAAGRSAGGGYASQQAGTFAAMEQAPQFYAEGARQASSQANQRMQMAETAAKGFGDLGTMTRGQDEQRAQFESNLGLSIADSVSRLTEGNVQMNDRDSQQMAEIWMDFAKLQSVYAGMTSEEQLGWWQTETARRGQDKNFEAIMKQMKEQGKISSKDIIGGLFQLGGGLMTTGGTLGAAYINRPQPVAA